MECNPSEWFLFLGVVPVQLHKFPSILYNWHKVLLFDLGSGNDLSHGDTL